MTTFLGSFLFGSVSIIMTVFRPRSTSIAAGRFADPDPGSGAFWPLNPDLGKFFLDPGSQIQPKSLVTILWLQVTYFLC